MTLAALHRRAAVMALGVICAVLTLSGPVAAQPAIDFGAFLADAGVEPDDIASLTESLEELTAEDVDVFQRVQFRLDQLERGQVDGISADDAVTLDQLSDEGALPAFGALVHLDGVVISREGLGATSAGAAPLWRYEVELPNGGGTITALSAHAPRAWQDRDPLHESVRAVGVYAGTEQDEDHRSVVLVSRFRWYPATGVPSGVAWLAARGFDAALLDDVRPVSAFSKGHESRESEAFYAGLAAVRDGDAAELRRLAREEVSDAVERWRDLARAAPTDDKASPSRTAQIAAAVEQRAERGVSSVGPMYLAAADTMGRLVLIEGVARRAVRIVVDEKIDAGDLRDYYELDLFTADSENLPIICCAVTLPAGFPTGDRINEPLRVAGVFFKRWAYLGRPDADDGESAERIAAPLILAVEPEWLRGAGAVSNSRRGLWIGGAFVAALALIWLAVAWAARGDRLARSRRSGYDAKLGVDLGPPPAEQ